jgi:hypothetical protein
MAECPIKFNQTIAQLEDNAKLPGNFVSDIDY